MLDQLFVKSKNKGEKKEKPVGQNKRRLGRTGLALAGLVLAANTVAEAQSPNDGNKDKEAIAKEAADKTEMTVGQQSPEIGPETIHWDEAVKNMTENNLEGGPDLERPISESYQNIIEIITSNPDNVDGYLVVDKDGINYTSFNLSPYSEARDIEGLKKEDPKLEDKELLPRYESIVVDNYDNFLDERGTVDVEKLIESKEAFTKVDILPTGQGEDPIVVISEIHEKGITITVGAENGLQYLLSYQVPDGLDVENGEWAEGDYPDDYKRETRRVLIERELYGPGSVADEIKRGLYRGKGLEEIMSSLNSACTINNLSELNLGEQRSAEIDKAAIEYISEISDMISQDVEFKLAQEQAAKEAAADKKTSEIKGAFSR
jgi:hypothetical protein